MDFWTIYDLHELDVRRFVVSRVGEEWAVDDVVQETFLRVQANIGQLRDSSKLLPWMLRIAHNLCQDYFKDAKRAAPCDQETLEAVLGENEPQASASAALEREQMGHCVQKQTRLLSDSLRTVLMLYDGMGFSHSEIAEILDITVDTAKTRLHRARKKMKKVLEQACDFESGPGNILTCVPKGL